jgi:hypothetical protein
MFPHAVDPHDDPPSFDGYLDEDLRYGHPYDVRFLETADAATGAYKKVDYNVLSVAAMTLSLILFVEVIRHKLDHHASHRPFFRTVLEGVYAECTYTHEGPGKFCTPLFVMGGCCCVAASFRI